MDACHFLEKHMDEVSEPNDEMVIHKKHRIRRLICSSTFDLLTFVLSRGGL